MENDCSLAGPATPTTKSEQQGTILAGLPPQITAADPPVNKNNSWWSEYNIEILNTMSASHINLRKERDTLVNKVECLTKSNTKLEENLLVAGQDNKRQLSEIEDLRNKKTDADQWKKSVLDLTEQHEKKKSILRRMNKKVQFLVRENRNLQQKHAATSAQIKSKYENRDRVLDELNNERKVNDKLMQEKNDMKSTITKLENELADAKNKEVQIRRVAIKYRDAFYALQKRNAERDGDLTKSSRRGGDTPPIALSPMSTVAGSTSQAIITANNANELLSLSPTTEQEIPHQEAKEQIELPSSLIGDRKRYLRNFDDAVTPTNKKTRSDDSIGESIKSVDLIFTQGSGVSSSIQEHMFTEDRCASSNSGKPSYVP